jgi:RNA polymerase sigma factor (sigma-70 family)
MSALAVVTKPAAQCTDDLDLVAAVRAGDDRAFELLFLRYQGRISSYVRGMVRDYGRAEDITQDVFMSALRRLRSTDAPIAFKPWIYEIAKNACIDAFRRARSVNEVSFDADDGPGSSMVARGGAPDAVVEGKLAIDNLCGAFGGLSEAHHDILVMREFEGLTYAEIGDRLGMSRAAVESTLFRARRRLSEEYEELVSGERCIRVRRIVDAPAGRAIGTRDQRRMARHIAHCQPCRRYARLAGMDLDVARARSRATRIAAVLPLPAFLRRRLELDDANQLLGQHTAPALHWSSKVVAVLDPATVSGWPKAIATAATVAVAGLGAGAAVGERDTLRGIVSQTPAIGAIVHGSGSHARDPRSTGRSPHGRSPAPSSASTPGSTGAARTGTGTPPSSTGSAPGAAAPHGRRPAAATADGFESTRAPVGAAPAVDVVKGVGATVPGTAVPAADAPLRDVTGDRPARKGPVGVLLDSVGHAVAGGVGASVPSTVGSVVDTIEHVTAQGGSQGTSASGATAADATGTAATAPGGTAGTAAGAQLPAPVGQTPGGGGAGRS